jgi:dUTP pyrophosphatase
MERIKVKIINRSGYELPAYETPSAAGMDIHAAIEEPIVLKPLQRALVPTGLRIQLPQGHECQIRPRSGLALRSGISLVNTPGTVDADYRGEIGVIVINLSDTPFTINPGERIAQMVITNYTHVEWEPVERLDETRRGEGAFGHTGLE